jgi:hypothetical protein
MNEQEIQEIVVFYVGAERVGKARKSKSDPTKWIVWCACTDNESDDLLVSLGEPLEEARKSAIKAYRLVQAGIKHYISNKGLDKPQIIEYDGRGGVK